MSGGREKAAVLPTLTHKDHPPDHLPALETRPCKLLLWIVKVLGTERPRMTKAGCADVVAALDSNF